MEKNKTIKSIFSNAIGINPQNIDSITLLGGMTNKNYLITAKNKKYVLRIPGNGTENMIDRISEGINTNLIASINLNKPLLYFNNQTGIKISEYIPYSITVDIQLAKKHLPHISVILKTLHNSKLRLNNTFNVFNEIEEYETLAKKSNAIFYPGYNKTKKDVLELRQQLESYKVNLAPCHNDPVPENFIKSNNKIYLIDWEYSGMNDPMWDLAALFLESKFSKEEEKQFSLLYFNRYATKEEEARIMIMKILQDFLWSIWTLLKEAQGDNFEDYGINRYNRAISALEILKVYE